MSLDCCHSRSGTRDFEINPNIKSRKADLSVATNRPAAGEIKMGIRGLDSYIGNYDSDTTDYTITDLTVSPVGQRFLAGSKDGTTKLIDLILTNDGKLDKDRITGREILTLPIRMSALPVPHFLQMQLIL